MEKNSMEMENQEQAFFRIPGSQFGVWKRKPCKDCFYRRPVVVFRNDTTMCHYLLDTGEKRGCSPYDCIRMGRFLPKTDGRHKGWNGQYAVRKMQQQKPLMEAGTQSGLEDDGEFS